MRMDSKHSHAHADAIDNAKLIHKILPTVSRKKNSAFGNRMPLPKTGEPKTGEAISRSKKMTPATITDDAK
jgi:hypothetical protein